MAATGHISQMQKTGIVTPSNGPESDATAAFGQLRTKIQEDYADLKNWRLVGEKWGINKGLAHMIAKDGHEPTREDLRRKLGLPPRGIMVQVWVFVLLALYARPPKPRIYRRWRDMPQWAIRWSLENRESI